MSTPAFTQSAPRKPVATWRKVLAAALDFIFVFAIAGYVIGYMTGNLTDGGFELKGGPAMMVFAIVALYFAICIKFLGGTVWQRLLGVKSRKTASVGIR